MNSKAFSNYYEIRKLTRDDVDAIYALESLNRLYYEYCPPFVTKQCIMDDLTALPKGKTMDDKYFVGYYEKDKLIAVLDVIDGYPETGIAFIGFFMTDVSLQKQGLGTAIITELVQYFTENGFHAVRLAWVKGNPQAEHFWLKNRFEPLMETTSSVSDHVILAERKLV